MEKDKLTLQEFSALLADKSGFSKQISETFCKELFSVVEEVLLAQDTLKISGLGTFKTQFVEPRRSVNIVTGEEMIIEGHNKVVFVPEKSLKELVNQPFAHLLPVELEDDDERLADFEKNKFTENSDDDNLSDQTSNSDEQPLKVLEQQADEIKNILAEIKGMSAEAEESDVSENIIPQIPEPENKAITENYSDSREEELQVRKTALAQGKYSPFYNEKESSSSEKEEAIVTRSKSYFDDETESKNNGKRKSGLWWKILLPLLLILLLVLLYLFVPTVKSKVDGTFFSLKKTQVPTDTIRASDLLKMNTIDSLRDDLIAAKSDSALTAAPKPDSVSAPKPPPPAEQKIVNQTPDYQKIKTTETIARGATLAALARKYYGHQDFWVYIFEANKTSLKNPNLLEIGAKINIPELDKSLIDLKNPDNVKKAREKARQILK
ncbi:MAG: HU family DNA-binding protein [Paludibacter sp.]|nr:HU family DNA-binding protein [Paludibacter sp.]